MLQQRAGRKVPLKLAAGAFLLFVAVRIGGGTLGPPPALETDCGTPGLALSATTVRAGAPVRYTVVGPPDGSYAVAVDAVAVRAAGAGVVAETAGGDRAVAAGPLRLRECRATGVLGLPFATAGTRTVSLFDLAGGRELRRVTVTLTDR